MNSRSVIWQFLVVVSLVLSLIFFSFTTCGEEDSNGIHRRGEAGMAFLELGTLNDALENQDYEGFSRSTFLSGASAFYKLSPNVRLGGAGYRGSSSNSFENGNGKLSFNFFGLLFESGISVTDSLTLMVGSVAGIGSMDLRITENIPSTFEDALTDTPNRHKLNKVFYGIQPLIAVEVGISSRFALQAKGGYLWGISDKWNLDGKKVAGPLNQVKAPIVSVTAHFGGTNDKEDG